MGDVGGETFGEMDADPFLMSFRNRLDTTGFNCSHIKPSCKRRTVVVKEELTNEISLK